MASIGVRPDPQTHPAPVVAVAPAHTLLELIDPIGHTEGVIMLEQQTWVTLSGFVALGLSLMGYLRNIKQDLKADNARLETQVAGVRTELKAELGDLRSELRAEIVSTHADLKTDIGRVDGRLVALESRVHDIAIRLPVAMTPVQPTAS